MRTPLPEQKDSQMFVYYYLMTGDRVLSFLLANYYPSGMPVSRRSGSTDAWKSKKLQTLLQETVRNMAKKKLKIHKPTNLPESKITTVEDVIATAEEVLIYLTCCMRGSINEEVLMTRSVGEGYQVIDRLMKQVAPKDRTKAAELLAKRYGLLENRVNLNVNTPVIFLGEDQLED